MAKKSSGTRKNAKSKTGQRSSSPPVKPALPTVKRLFAVSQNKCAFPDCRTPMVDPGTSSVLGQICHIKGEKPGAARYDVAQSDVERHAFDNLILLCGVHHKIVDDNESTYSVRRIQRMKAKHEKPNGRRRLTEPQAEQMIAAIGNAVNHGSIIANTSQSGGQSAHAIYNFGDSTDENVKVEASISIDSGFAVLQKFGCPGVVVQIACKSKRPAKIRSIMICKEGRGFLKKFASAFGTEFPHSPPPGLEAETLCVDLEPLDAPTRPNGHVLDRDDSCRFFLPLATCGLAAFLIPPPDSVSIRAVFFDNSESVLREGEEIQDMVRSLIDAFGDRPWDGKGASKMSVRVSSTEPGKPPVEAYGTANYKPLQLVDPSDLSDEDRQLGNPFTLRPVIVQGPEATRTIGIAIGKTGRLPSEPIECSVELVGLREDTKSVHFLFHGAEGFEAPRDTRIFILPFENVADARSVCRDFPPHSYGLALRLGMKRLAVLPGQLIREMFRNLDQEFGVSKGQRRSEPVNETGQRKVSPIRKKK